MPPDALPPNPNKVSPDGCPGEEDIITADDKCLSMELRSTLTRRAASQGKKKLGGVSEVCT